jgi:hypothetical protein
VAPGRTSAGLVSFDIAAKSDIADAVFRPDTPDAAAM